ncbi:MAG TPA: 3-methyl-2-oxobutanoate hydroxymethyltransferase [Vicinamibacterales bacterium]|jgi:3-methyl-2-oxobutanoate hydroxymethyltransferase|nr:3-methyl-2-oxobutanoate hydroxymethyltransferase [Vicinamibacterales bacterium]
MAGDQPAKPRITPFHFRRAKERGDLIAMITAYDAPSARLAEAAAVDGILVGDSAAMTVLGHDSTVQITVDEMLVLTRAVSRSVYKPLVVADMPFGSFQVSDEEAVRHAVRLVKEGGAGAVKLEGAGPTLTRVKAIVGVGIPVMGHVGLTPQSAVALGGYRVQGRRARDARRLLDEARALQGAGCFAVVIEAMPAVVAARITEALEVPTIGIGAGPACDGQILVWHDLLGLTTGHVPQFVKRYADLGATAKGALAAYVADVRQRKFPDDQHTYDMAEGERELFELDLKEGDRKQGGSRL